MVTNDAFRSTFAAAVSWPAYLATATSTQRPNWDRAYASAKLTVQQRAFVGSFTRRINVLVISGTWCGDCVQQCPLIARIAEAFPAASGDGASPGIDLRFIDRDEHAGFCDQFMICGGRRVPTVLFLNEDFDFLSILGDRTLSRYRAIAARSLGPSCPLPGAPLPADESAATTADWLAEFERVALMLRLSPKLRERHGD